MGEVIFKPLNTGNRKPWTLEERQYMLAHHTDMYIENIAKHLGRTLAATKSKASTMGCSIRTIKGNNL